MKCPHCQAITEIPDHVLRNVQTYQKIAHIAAPCCKKPLVVSPVFKVDVYKEFRSDGCDDWGVPYNTKEN